MVPVDSSTCSAGVEDSYFSLEVTFVSGDDFSDDFSGVEGTTVESCSGGDGCGTTGSEVTSKDLGPKTGRALEDS